MTFANKPLITAQTYTLKNGLKVIVVPSGLAPVVTVGIVYHVGTADDPIDEVGLSHFLEHMMFKGTKKIPGAEFNKQILQKGGQNNAQTSYDYTLYHTTIAKKHLEFIISAEADRMRNLTFQEHEIISEMGVVLEERLMRFDNNPFGTAYESFLRAMHPYHPYGVTPIGFPHHIKKYTFQSVRKHYDTWYHPNNATIIITGKVTLAEILPHIEKEFGNFEKKDTPIRRRPQNPPREGVTQLIKQYNKRNSAILLQYSYDAPQFRSELGKTYYYPLTVLSHLLGGNQTTEFYTNFVENKKLALSVSSEYDGISIDPRDFSISAMLQPTANVDAFYAELKAIFARLINSGVSQDDLERTKADLTAQLAYTKDGTTGFLQTIAEYVALGISIEEINEWQKKIEAVTIDDIKKAAQLIFKEAPVVTLEIHPKQRAAHPEHANAQKPLILSRLIKYFKTF
ncbi:MAG: pitrilysin family protein [Candidatus Paracaedibacteraceae bacterium]|nr:pitrilysin family protein [Candidatus Paracaedibacteraceae bacterium]